jgi:polyisoprenoid-binding protein YceI
MKRILLTTVVASLLILPTLASAGTWQIDAAHSSITFKIRHLFTKVQGAFTEVEGEIEFDPANPTAGSVKVKIPVASIDTRNEKRDGHLKSPDFFDAETYPEIVFESTKVEETEGGLQVTGDFTMHGVTKPVTLDVEFLGAGPHPMVEGAKVAGFTATTKIDRTEWGLKWNKVIEAGGALLGDEVDIQIDVEALSEAKGAK